MLTQIIFWKLSINITLFFISQENFPQKTHKITTTSPTFNLDKIRDIIEGKISRIIIPNFLKKTDVNESSLDASN